MTTTAPSRFEAALHWVDAPLENFFRVEIDNERNGGVSPATISSAIDSLTQAPTDVIESWFDDGDVVRSLIALLQVADLMGTDTELEDFVRELQRRRRRENLPE